MSEWDDLAEMVDRPPHDKPAGQGVHLLRVNTKGSAIGREHGRLGRMLANHHNSMLPPKFSTAYVARRFAA